MIDPQVASSAAAGTNRVRAFEEPGASFEAKIRAGQCSNRADVYDVHRVRICQRDIFINPNFRFVTSIEYLNLVRMGDIASETDAARAQNATLLIEFYLGPERKSLTPACLFPQGVTAVMSCQGHVVV